MLIQCKRCGGMSFDDHFICKKCGAVYCKECAKNNGGKCRECGSELSHDGL